MAAPRSTGVQGTQKHPRLLGQGMGAEILQLHRGLEQVPPRRTRGLLSLCGTKNLCAEALPPAAFRRTTSRDEHVRDQKQPQRTLRCSTGDLGSLRAAEEPDLGSQLLQRVLRRPSSAL